MISSLPYIIFSLGFHAPQGNSDRFIFSLSKTIFLLNQKPANPPQAAPYMRRVYQRKTIARKSEIPIECRKNMVPAVPTPNECN